MAEIKFTDNSFKIKGEMNDLANAFLLEAVAELQSETARNTRVDTGQTKGSWETSVDEVALEAVVGSTLENAIWEEFGTGEFAVEGNGRKGGWFYEDNKGEGHFTYGKQPNRTLQNAFDKLKPKIIKAAEEKLKGLGK